tara:strand:- start:202 stop:477 length:276 start_codon:yes stop_codon:yes gene_type:complete
MLGGNLLNVRLLQPMKKELSHKEHQCLIEETVEHIGYLLGENTNEGYETVKDLLWELDVKHLLNFAMEDEPEPQLGEPEHDPYSHHHPNNH